jgi:drug/metabolite transporter (DMT)-like permease
MPSSHKGIILAIITAVFWGFLAIGLKLALQFFDSYSIVWFRFTFAFASMFIYFAITKPSYLIILRKPPLLLVIGSLLLGINYIGFMQGINYAGPGISQVLIQTGPVILGLIGFVIFKEKITLLRGVGIALTSMGFLVFYYQQLQHFVSQENLLNNGVIWILVAATAWAGYAVCNKLLVRNWNPLQLNLIFNGLPAIGFAFLTNFTLFFQPYPWWVWPLMILLGLNTVIAYGALSIALKHLESNKISIIITLNPIITFMLLELMLYFGLDWFEIKPFPPMAYLGAFFIVSGAILAIGITGLRRNRQKL